MLLSVKLLKKTKMRMKWAKTSSELREILVDILKNANKLLKTN